MASGGNELKILNLDLDLRLMHVKQTKTKGFVYCYFIEREIGKRVFVPQNFIQTCLSLVSKC